MAQSLRHALEAKILAGVGPFKRRFNEVAALPANKHLKVAQF